MLPSGRAASSIPDGWLRLEVVMRAPQTAREVVNILCDQRVEHAHQAHDGADGPDDPQGLTVYRLGVSAPF